MDYPTDWQTAIHTFGERRFQARIERYAYATRKQSMACPHKHRTKAAAQRCADRMLATPDLFSPVRDLASL